MNSIESYSPPKVTSLDGDAKDLSNVASDPSALETLRAMMGGIVPQQLGLQQPSVSSPDRLNAPANLVSLLTKALSDEGLPPSLAPLIQSLSKSLTTSVAGDSSLSALRAALGQPAAPTSATTASPLGNPMQSISLSDLSPEVIEQMKQLLAELDSATPSHALPLGATLATQQSSPLQEMRTALTKALAAPEEQPVVKPTTIEQQPNEASLGQSILQSLGAQSSAATANISATTLVNATPTVERVEQVSALMTEMADRVLVTDPVHGQTPEVRVKLAESIMPGTEVRVWRETGGELRVAFDTNSAYWARVLNDASPMLAQRLNDRLPSITPPQIIVQQQGGQPEDGRSRNRQNPWDVAQEAEA